MSAPGHPGEKHQQVTPAYEPKEVTMNATFGSSLLEPKCGIHCLLYDDTCTPKACQARYMYTSQSNKCSYFSASAPALFPMPACGRLHQLTSGLLWLVTV